MSKRIEVFNKFLDKKETFVLFYFYMRLYSYIFKNSSVYDQEDLSDHIQKVFNIYKFSTYSLIVLSICFSASLLYQLLSNYDVSKAFIVYFLF